MLGTAKVLTGKTEANVTVKQVGADAGSVYVTISNIGKKESARVEKTFEEEPQSAALSAASITVTNNCRIADIVYVPGLTAGNVVKVYKDATTTKALGTATVATGKQEVNVRITQKGEAGGTIYVTLTESGKNESSRIAVDFKEEETTKVISADNITVTNNIKIKSDTVKVTGLTAGDIVKVYSLETAGTLLGTATVPVGKTEANVTVRQVGVDEGSVYVTIANVGKKECARVEKTFVAEPQSTNLSANVVTVTNNSTSTAYTIKVTDLTSGSIIKVYKYATTATFLGRSIVPTGVTETTFNISRTGVVGEKLYITVTEVGKNESERTEVSISSN
jgi:hypothetical protein